MANMLGDGAAWLLARLQESASITVSLRRNGQETTGVTAMVGTTQAVAEEADGTILTLRSRDFIIAVADYEISGSVVEPASGDLIVETSGEDEIRYEVVPFADEPNSRYFDPQRNAWRIHTKQIAATDEDEGERNLTEDELRGILGVLPA